MILIAISIGLIGGLILGFACGFTYPVSYSFYITMALLAAMDSVFGAARAYMMNKYDSVVFISGFVVNAILAAALARLGDLLGVPLYYAVIFAFGVRLFDNLSGIRHIILDKIRKSRRKKD